MNARFLFTCWPFEGHIGPQLGIAHALGDRGHQVAFYTAPGLCEAVEHEGFEVFGFSAVQDAWVAVHELESQTIRRRQSPKVQHDAFRNWLVETIPGQVADLKDITSSWRPDVVVTESSMWGPMLILWETTAIPVAMSSTFMGPMIPGPDAPPWGLGMAPPRTRRGRAAAWAVQRITDLLAQPLRRRVDALRAEHGLRAMGCSINEYSARLPLQLVGNIPELDYDRRDLPACVHYVGPCSKDLQPPAETAQWLEPLPTKHPWVHVTEGTSHYKRAFLLQSASRGLADGPWEVLLTTGRNRDTVAVELPAAPNVHTTQWLSHNELLPRCDVMVTTGGAGGIVAAAKAAVPLVVVPTNWDKPDNARRVVEAGMGIRLAARKCTPRTLRAAVQEVLSNPHYRTNAQRIAARVAQAPGPEGAGDLLERLAATRGDRQSVVQSDGDRR